MAASDSKAVVRREQGGAVVSASTSSAIRKRVPKTALEEDEFTDVKTPVKRET